jgi:hypothetical protein
LAKEYRTRIEMRQIGARDEARLLADYETCGREVCCKVFLKTLKPISMRMAKLQKATLDPSQVSGRCGRLKCCLRYEHVGYEALEKRLPRTGVRIRTEHGEGVVVNRQILTQLVQIRTDADTVITVVAEDITAVNVPAPPQHDAERSGSPKSTEVQKPAGQTRAAGPFRLPKRRAGRRSPGVGKTPAKARPTKARAEPGEASTPAESASSSPEAQADKKTNDVQPSRRRRRRRGRRRRRPGDSEGSSGGPPPSTDS